MTAKPLEQGDVLECSPLFPMIEGTGVTAKVTDVQGGVITMDLTVLGVWFGTMTIRKTGEKIVRSLKN